MASLKNSLIIPHTTGLPLFCVGTAIDCKRKGPVFPLSWRLFLQSAPITTRVPLVHPLVYLCKGVSLSLSLSLKESRPFCAPMKMHGRENRACFVFCCLMYSNKASFCFHDVDSQPGKHVSLCAILPHSAF